jgi:hypothetical protein
MFAVDHLHDMIDGFRRTCYDSYKKASGKAHVDDDEDDEDGSTA